MNGQRQERESGMGIWQAIGKCIVQKYMTCSGRASRTEFFSYLVAFILFCIFWVALIAGIIALQNDINLLDFVLLYIPFLFVPPLVAVSVRRLHDCGRSGWLALWLLVPFVNIFGFGLLCMRSEPGPNRYGSPAPEVDF